MCTLTRKVKPINSSFTKGMLEILELIVDKFVARNDFGTRIQFMKIWKRRSINHLAQQMTYHSLLAKILYFIERMDAKKAPFTHGLRVWETGRREERERSHFLKATSFHEQNCISGGKSLNTSTYEKNEKWNETYK